MASWFLAVPGDRRPQRFGRCVLGLCLFGAGATAFLASDLGAAPWDVFHQGLARQLGLPVGLVMQAVSLLIVAAWLPLGLRPGWATLFNALEIGFTVLMLEPIVPEFDSIPVRLAECGIGLVLVGVGTGLYIGAGLGSGPRDGLMLAAAARGVSLRVARTAIEATVLVAGIALGGTVGVGTAIFVLGIGPVVHVFLPRFTMPTGRLAAVHNSLPS